MKFTFLYRNRKKLIVVVDICTNTRKEEEARDDHVVKAT